MPREGKAALTPASMLGNKANTLTRTQGVIVRGIRDLTASPTPKWTNSLMRYAKTRQALGLTVDSASTRAQLFSSQPE
jgi:hypothetical protein